LGLPLVDEPESAVEGFADNIFNITAFYDKGPFQVRFALNFRDTFLAEREGGLSHGLPEHVSSFTQLDFSASYDITKNLALVVEGININDAKRLRFEDTRERVNKIQFTGRRFSFGARFVF